MKSQLFQHAAIVPSNAMAVEVGLKGLSKYMRALTIS